MEKKKMAVWKKILIAIAIVIIILVAAGLFMMWNFQRMMGGGNIELSEEHMRHEVDASQAGENTSTVYMTTEITPEALMEIYEALGVELEGNNIGVKLSTGEPPASNYLDP